ncbi:acyltransferase domain-containing protein [Streptomyces antnestii]|uniref:acyltransferase domain-containing protein n=1 Tax=Streptomyces antnestii TaxID=2494256 RepID=UPI0016759576|nr:acyltransferase domain-containing protein [Streptomyces sp. San01]
MLREWAQAVEGQERVEAAVPDAADLPDVLLDLGVAHEDVNELVALRPRVTDDPGTLALLERCVGAVVRDMGTVGGSPRFPAPPDGADLLGRCFSVYVYVAALPYTRAYHRGLGVPEDVSRRTLADLGRHMAVHRRRYGSCGIHAVSWLGLHFHGELYQLGRLQYQRAALGGRSGEGIAAAGVPLKTGDPCLSLHIPDFRGPLSPEACDRSLLLAEEFFARHYPAERYEIAVCHSWLLDAQLRRYLRPDSNLVRFQERFRTAWENREPDDRVPVGFVFGDPDLPVETLPRRTSVERAVGDHLRAGGHWYGGHGWFPLSWSGTPAGGPLVDGA